LYEIVFGSCLIWFLDLMSKPLELESHYLFGWIIGMQFIRWHDTATDESTEGTKGAFFIAPSEVTIFDSLSIPVMRSLHGDTDCSDNQ
jgi:hypothetical protein